MRDVVIRITGLEHYDNGIKILHYSVCLEEDYEDESNSNQTILTTGSIRGVETLVEFTLASDAYIDDDLPDHLSSYLDDILSDGMETFED